MDGPELSDKKFLFIFCKAEVHNEMVIIKVVLKRK